jgi:hypothetical protein
MRSEQRISGLLIEGITTAILSGGLGQRRRLQSKPGIVRRGVLLPGVDSDAFRGVTGWDRAHQ